MSNLVLHRLAVLAIAVFAFSLLHFILALGVLTWTVSYASDSTFASFMLELFRQRYDRWLFGVPMMASLGVLMVVSIIAFRRESLRRMSIAWWRRVLSPRLVATLENGPPTVTDGG
jgi:hypothetical protein